MAKPGDKNQLRPAAQVLAETKDIREREAKKCLSFQAAARQINEAKAAGRLKVQLKQALEVTLLDTQFGRDLRVELVRLGYRWRPAWQRKQDQGSRTDHLNDREWAVLEVDWDDGTAETAEAITAGSITDHRVASSKPGKVVDLDAIRARNAARRQSKEHQADLQTGSDERPRYNLVAVDE